MNNCKKHGWYDPQYSECPLCAFEERDRLRELCAKAADVMHHCSDHQDVISMAEKLERYARRPTVPQLYSECPLCAFEERDRLREERDIAIRMLAEWCVAIDVNGTGWDDWDEYYKDAAYRPGPLRELLDKAIAQSKEERRSE